MPGIHLGILQPDSHVLGLSCKGNWQLMDSGITGCSAWLVALWFTIAVAYQSFTVQLERQQALKLNENDQCLIKGMQVSWLLLTADSDFLRQHEVGSRHPPTFERSCHR